MCYLEQTSVMLLLEMNKLMNEQMNEQIQNSTSN